MDLQGANLQQARYNNATWFPTGFDLSETGAYFIGSGASLQNANLAGANLSEFNLAGANLNEANLTEAIMPDGTTDE
jgi:uncharacterized protein YjbI with pentapeptide repeats